MDKFSVLKQLFLLFAVLLFLGIEEHYHNKKVKIFIMALFIGVLFYMFTPVSIAATPVTSAKYAPKTELSKKAANLQVNMTKQQVIKLLGKPDWAEHVQGVPLALIWQNGECNPVYVVFDKHMKVNGYNEGRAECMDQQYTELPARQYSCALSGNQALCSARS